MVKTQKKLKVKTWFQRDGNDKMFKSVIFVEAT